MAHLEEILVHGVATQVWNMDSTAQQIDDVVGMMSGGKNIATGLASLGAKSRLNLLVNEHFVENSRGQEEYTAAGYTVDGWRLNAATGTVTVLPHGIRFSSTSTAQLSQWIAAAYDDLANHTLTVSGYIDNVLYTATATIPSAKPTAYTTFARVDIADNCFLAFSWSASSQKFEVRINFTAAGSVFIPAAKLEFGDKSTLAYPEVTKAPNLAESLLENGDFMLNSLGKTEYSSAGITFDNWTLAKKSGSDFKVSAAAEGVRISKSNGFGYIKQALDPETVSGKTLNISMLAKGTGYIYALIMVNGASYGTGLVATKMTDDYTLYSVYRTLNSDLTAAELRVGTQESNPSGYVDIKAIKVELGDQSTLEPLVDKTIWTLVDQPDRPVEALRSACYYDGEWQGLIHGIGAQPRENLLLNPLFKINQRGKTKYTGSGYTVDGWVITNSNMTVQVQNDCLLLSCGSSGHGYLRQYQEVEIPSGTYTLSALVKGSGSMFLNIASATSSDSFTGIKAYNLTGDWSLCTFTYQVTDTLDWTPQQFYMRVNQGSTCYIKAFKAELGPTQTLARQLEDGTWELLEQPDPLELLKCQRYLVVYDTYGQRFVGVGNTETMTKILGVIYLPVPMRIIPTITGDLSVFGGKNNLSASNVSISGVGSTGLLVSLTVSGMQGSEQLVSLYTPTQLILSAEL